MSQDTPRKLYRSRDDRMIAGVCGGLAEYFSIDATLVRLAAVLLLFFFGTAFIVYMICWIVIPEVPATVYDFSSPVRPDAEDVTNEAAGAKATSAPRTPPSASQSWGVDTAKDSEPIRDGAFRFGFVLVVLGVLFFVSRFFVHFSIFDLWPIVIIGFGFAEMFTAPKNGKRWGISRLFSGLNTTLLGLILLGCTTGIFSWALFGQLFFLWPVLLVSAGLALIGSAARSEVVKSLASIVVTFALIFAVLLSSAGWSLAHRWNTPDEFFNDVGIENNSNVNSR